MNFAATEATRAADLTQLLAGSPKSDDHNGVREYLHCLAAAGCAALLIYPGSKVAADPRPARQRIAADEAAQQAARDAGRRGWQRITGAAGVYLATNDPTTLDTYLEQYTQAFGASVEVNVAISVGRSRLVVVDCDTPEELAAFLMDACADADAMPTVRTPGARTHTGEWVHSDGGHFWFTVPEGVEMPAGTEYKDSAGGYTVLWGPGRYVLTPPSVRAEGTYMAPDGGAVHELPDWLRDRIIERAPLARAVADRSVITAEATVIDAWSRAVTWAEILAPLGWTPTGRFDACGCETWTAPGEHASPKSATGHEPGCAEPKYDTENPPLHIWTDNPGEPFAGYITDRRTQTLSKLQVVALVEFDNDVGAAMETHGLVTDPVTLSAGQADDRSGDNLPESFWAAHPALAHIRQAAHRGVNSADAVMGAVLVHVAAHLDPSVTVDTGVKHPMPLSMFVGLVGSAGTGKSSAYSAAGRLLQFEFPALMAPGLIASGHERPLELPVGSGPGLAEAFMGAVVDPDNPKAKPIRMQTSHKLLLHSDEGAGLVAGILDPKRGQDIGPALRTAWTGATLGQANASVERKRQVRDYVVGLCVGFQLEALAALSTPEQLEYGTPQRFLYVSATDPAIPDGAPDDPGVLTVKLPSAGLRYSDELQVRARQEAIARTRGLSGGGGVTHDPMDAHRPALLARLAALLLVLCDPGRSVIEASDVELAETLLRSSGRLHGKAVSYRREREAAEAERKATARISEQVTAAVAVDKRTDRLAEHGERIVKFLAKAGGTGVWKGRDGLRQKFKSTDRVLADMALDQLVDSGTLSRDGDRLSCRDTSS